ncbi:MAG TPA: glycosyltransferase family 2 protein [Anaerolineae bacterium]|nr:glycosyltransferase family 2 protein [Anaerolineae bacterium]
MVNATPRLSIIIVNWNTRTFLEACLEAVYATVQSPTFEIWVVDNASSDDSVAWLRAYCPNVQLIENAENIGFAAANNQALEQCAGEYALLLNSDVILLPNAVEQLVACLDAESSAAAVAPMLLNTDGSFQAGPNDDLSVLSETLLALGMDRFLRGGHFPGYEANAPRGAYAWVGGTCLLMRRAAWQQVGTLDPAYFMYTEEADWCWRARQAGWTIWYEPAARVIHAGGGSSRRVQSAMRAQLYKSKLLFFIKHRPRWQAFLLRTILLLTAAVKSGMYELMARLNRTQRFRFDERARSFRLVYRTVFEMSA